MKKENLKHFLKTTEYSIGWINADGDAIDRHNSDADNQADAEKDLRSYLEKWGMPENAVAWVIEKRIDYFPAWEAPNGEETIFKTLDAGGDVYALREGGWLESDE